MNRPIRSAALAALSLLPALTAKPAHAQHPPPPPALAATDVALAGMIAGRPLSAREKAVVTDMDRDLFQREPDSLLQNMRQQVEVLKKVRRFDPVHLADWRKAQLTTDYFSQDAHGIADVNKTYLAIYTHDNPIIYADPDTKTLVCQRDVDAWQAASRVLSAASGVPTEHARDLIAVARDPRLELMARIRAAHMERNWICYQLCWAHEPAADRNKTMAGLVGGIRRVAARGPAGASQAGAALVLAASAYSDYPASLDPKYAARAGFIKRGAMMNRVIESGNAKVGVWDTGTR